MSKCKICGEKADLKHHTSYEPEKTINVCRSCHSKIHHNDSFRNDLLPDKQGPRVFMKMSDELHREVSKESEKTGKGKTQIIREKLWDSYDLSSENEDFERTGLGLSHLKILLEIIEGATTQAQVAEETNYSQPWISQCTRDLVEEGIIADSRHMVVEDEDLCNALSRLNKKGVEMRSIAGASMHISKELMQKSEINHVVDQTDFSQSTVYEKIRSLKTERLVKKIEGKYVISDNDYRKFIDSYFI